MVALTWCLERVEEVPLEEVKPEQDGKRFLPRNESAGSPEEASRAAGIAMTLLVQETHQAVAAG